MPAIAPRKKITPPALAAQWGVDVAKILHWIRSGELRAVNLATDPNGRPRYAIDQADILAFELSRQVQPPPPRVRRRRADPAVHQFF
jgi:hypothetical protein